LSSLFQLLTGLTISAQFSIANKNFQFGENTMQNLMPLNTIIKRLEAYRLNYVMEKTGMTYPTLRRVRAGGEGISLRTWKRLSDFFQAESSAG